jgi:transcriptional regulator with XRE-family HTH domain
MAKSKQKKLEHESRSTPAEQKLDLAIGKRIKAQRQKLGMSQTKLGDVLGISFQQVQKYENGSNRLAGSRFIGMAKALKVSPALLLNVKEADADVPDTPRNVVAITKIATTLDAIKQASLLSVAKSLAA